MLTIPILSPLTGWHCVKKLLLNTWRQRDLPFHVSTLFHLQTCWTSSPKGVAPERYIYVAFPFIFVFSICPVSSFHYCVCDEKITQCLLQVTVHLSKLFNSMSDLEFAKNEQLDNPKLAVGMYSKEKEYVPFQAECRCSGTVRLYSESKNRN